MGTARPEPETRITPVHQRSRRCLWIFRTQGRKKFYWTLEEMQKTWTLTWSATIPNELMRIASVDAAENTVMVTEAIPTSVKRHGPEAKERRGAEHTPWQTNPQPTPSGRDPYIQIPSAAMLARPTSTSTNLNIRSVSCDGIGTSSSPINALRTKCATRSSILDISVSMTSRMAT